MPLNLDVTPPGFQVPGALQVLRRLAEHLPDTAGKEAGRPRVLGSVEHPAERLRCPVSPGQPVHEPGDRASGDPETHLQEYGAIARTDQIDVEGPVMVIERLGTAQGDPGEIRHDAVGTDADMPELAESVEPGSQADRFRGDDLAADGEHPGDTVEHQPLERVFDARDELLDEVARERGSVVVPQRSHLPDG